MSTEEKAYIRQLAEELALASHQARDKEVSGLFMDIKRSITGLERDVKDLRVAVEALESDYKSNVLPNIKTWNSTADNQSRVVWIVIGAVIVALLGVIGLQ